MIVQLLKECEARSKAGSGSGIFALGQRCSPKVIERASDAGAGLYLLRDSQCLFVAVLSEHKVALGVCQCPRAVVRLHPLLCPGSGANRGKSTRAPFTALRKVPCRSPEMPKRAAQPETLRGPGCDQAPIHRSAQVLVVRDHPAQPYLLLRPR